KILATELLELNGTSPSELIPSGIISETLGFGASSNIDISTAQLILQNGGAINNRTYSPAPSGDLTINATDFIEMKGTSPKTALTNVLTTVTLFSTELEQPVQTAKAGDLTISTPYLSMTDGSYISSLSISDSSGGNVRINTDKLAITGGVFNSYYTYFSTAISGVGYRRGNSGSVTLNTDTLNIKDGAIITTSNLGSGNAGNVNVNATESVEIESFFPVAENEIFTSSISSTVGSDSILIQQTSGYQALGNSGNVTVNTPLLKISDEARVSVANFGTVGTAGRLKISSDSIELNKGIIAASAISGEGGNIDLNL
ncbi:MAG: filamentous hemagglutinin, partial [Cyanobacteria bacterium J06628_3]